jgi:hypothetical protein
VKRKKTKRQITCEHCLKLLVRVAALQQRGRNLELQNRTLATQLDNANRQLRQAMKLNPELPDLAQLTGIAKPRRIKGASRGRSRR